MAVKLIALGLLVGTIGCVPSGKKAASKAKSETAEVPPTLGMGYDTEMFKNKDICVEFTRTPQSGSGIQYLFERVESLDDRMSSLGFESSVALSYGLATGKATAGFATSLKETAFSATYLFDMSVMNGSAHATGIKVSVPSSDPAAFRMQCGDRYVSEVSEGGRLLAAVTFLFSDRDSKDSFNSTFSLGVKTLTIGADISAKLEKMVTEANQKTTIRISLNQKGGDPALLKQAFPNGEDVLICDLQNRTNCKNAITGLFNYATQVFPGSVSTRPYNYSYSTEYYPGVPGSVLAQDGDKKILKDATAALIKDATSDRQILNDLLAYQGGYGTASRKADMAATLNAVNDNLSKLLVNIRRCIDGSGACEPVEKLGLATYSKDLLVPVGDVVITAAIGGFGGGKVVQSCADYAAGLHGESGFVLNMAGVVCNNGDHQKLVGARPASSFDQRCPIGSVLTGVQGRREVFERMTLIGSLVLECTPLDVLRSGGSARNEVVVFSGEEERSQSARCEPGQAVKAVVFGAGNLVDSIGLQCIKVL